MRLLEAFLLESFNEAFELRIDFIVDPDLRFESEELIFCRQLPEYQQEGCLGEPRTSYKLVDWETAILENTLLTIEV